MVGIVPRMAGIYTELGEETTDDSAFGTTTDDSRSIMYRLLSPRSQLPSVVRLGVLRELVCRC